MRAENWKGTIIRRGGTIWKWKRRNENLLRLMLSKIKEYCLEERASREDWWWWDEKTMTQKNIFLLPEDYREWWWLSEIQFSMNTHKALYSHFLYFYFIFPDKFKIIINGFLVETFFLLPVLENFFYLEEN